MSARHVPRTMSIRRWLALALLSLFLAPLLTIVVIGAMIFGPTGGPRAEEIDEELISYVEGNAATWTDPAWQAELQDRYGDDAVVVLVIGDEEVFRTGEPFADSDTRRVRAVTIPDADPAQVASIYLDPEDGPPAELQRWYVPVALMGVLVLTLAVIAWFLRRAIVQPLEQTSDAALRIAHGELDISLPGSRVREIDELANAFEAMSDELRTSLAHRAAMEEERRLFIAAIAHDLRTPLFALRGSLQGLTQGVAASAEQRGRYIGLALAKADQLERLVADLFTFTRIEYMGETPSREPVDLAVFLNDLADGNQQRADERLISVMTRAKGPVSGPVIMADTHLLTRAIENMLDNALRHTPNEGTIHVAWHESGESVTITITDSGPGFPEQDLPHVFDPLYRGDASRNRETGGAGLGLAIAQRIVVAHSGTLSATNAETGGARLVMMLPKR